jgi:hypothetical protein
MKHDRQQRYLDLADRHIAAAERRIDRQRQIVAELRRGGQDAALALELLTTMQAVLDGMQRHRDYIEAQSLKSRSRLN